MAFCGVYLATSHPELTIKAHELTKNLNCHLLPSWFDHSGEPHDVALVLNNENLSLAFRSAKHGKPFAVDFTSLAFAKKIELPKKHIFRKALGEIKGPATIIDATSGLGQDSVALASLLPDDKSSKVFAIEQSAIVFALVLNAVARALQEQPHAKVSHHLQRIEWIQADAQDWLTQNSPVDIIYLDPMFDKPKKSAKSPKEMQLLKEILPSPAPDSVLLEAALKAARKRVIIKRPLKASAGAIKPSLSFKGQSIRYDVYLRQDGRVF